MENLWIHLIIAGVILLLTYGLNLVINNIIKRTIKKKDNKDLKTILLFLKKIKTLILFSLGILIALIQFPIFSSFSITILSALGLLGAVIGLALKESLNNFFGSVELVLNKPFKVDDFIKIPELSISGTVEEVSIRHTILRNLNNERIILPNSSLNTLVIENANYSDNEIILFGDYSVAYNTDLDKAMNIIKEEISKICEVDAKGINKDMEFPKVRVVKWDESAIILRAWVVAPDLSKAYENLFNLNYILKNRFDKEKIEIPYNYLNVVMKKK